MTLCLKSCDFFENEKTLNLNHLEFCVDVNDVNINLDKQFVVFPQCMKEFFSKNACELSDSVISVCSIFDVVNKQLPSINFIVGISCVMSTIYDGKIYEQYIPTNILDLNIMAYENDNVYIFVKCGVSMIISKKNYVQCVIRDNDNFMFISKNKLIYKNKSELLVCDLDDNKNSCNITGTYKINKKIVQVIEVIVNDHNLTCKYKYKNAGVSLDYCKKSIVNENSETFYEQYVKNNILESQLVEIHNKLTNDYSCVGITKCMFNDETTGLKKRGTVKRTIKNNSETVTHSINDDIIRQQTDGKVITDVITDKLKIKEDIIGWKICKNSNGEYRIVKLKIPKTANYLMAIDDEYFMCYRKHRSNVAIVIDIQLPELYDEISVSYTEQCAYSFVFESTPMCYKIGNIVTSNYSDNVTIGCAEGIHWYKERKYAFVHIPEMKDKIACKYD